MLLLTHVQRVFAGGVMATATLRLPLSLSVRPGNCATAFQLSK
jgi:hypothetical protein